MLSCMLAAAARFGGYISVGSAAWVLPFEAAHGWSFAITYTSMALMAEEHAASGLQATILGICR